MWLAINAVRNMDCNSDEDENDCVTFERKSSINEPDLLCKIPYPEFIASVSSTVSICLNDLLDAKHRDHYLENC